MDVDFASSGAEIVVKVIVRLVEARMASIPVEHTTDHRLPEVSALSSAPLGPRTFRELFLCACANESIMFREQSALQIARHWAITLDVAYNGTSQDPMRTPSPNNACSRPQYRVEHLPASSNQHVGWYSSRFFD